MPTSDYLKQLLIVGTPLETPARILERSWIAWRDPNTRGWLEQDHYIDEIIRRILQKDSNCIDIGCHLGSMLSPMVKFAPFGQHLAFEPIPYKAQWLKRKFPGVKVFEMCLSSSAGEVPFYYCPQTSGYSSLMVEENKKAKCQVIKVRCDRLDDIVSPDRQIDLVKIDVEGAELEVLRGASRILKESKPYLIFECSVDSVKSFGKTPEALYDFLCNECGYAIFLPKDWLQGGGSMSKEAFASASVYPAISYNFFGVSKDKI